MSDKKTPTIEEIKRHVTACLPAVSEGDQKFLMSVFTPQVCVELVDRIRASDDQTKMMRMFNEKLDRMIANSVTEPARLLEWFATCFEEQLGQERAEAVRASASRATAEAQRASQYDDVVKQLKVADRGQFRSDTVESLVMTARERHALKSEIDGLRAARVAYASEFPPDEDGEPDVGSIHQNIRSLIDDVKVMRAALAKIALIEDGLTAEKGNEIEAARTVAKDALNRFKP
jgi:hypothetical protein